MNWFYHISHLEKSRKISWKNKIQIKNAFLLRRRGPKLSPVRPNLSYLRTKPRVILYKFRPQSNIQERPYHLILFISFFLLPFFYFHVPTFLLNLFRWYINYKSSWRSLWSNSFKFLSNFGFILVGLRISLLSLSLRGQKEWKP